MTKKPENSWAAIEEAIKILKTCQFYTQCYIIPEEEWLRVQAILIPLTRQKLPEAVENVVQSLLSLCPHGKQSRKDCERCWDAAMEWI